MLKTNNKRILVVEDEDPLRDLYVQILKEEGYQVESAQNGELAYKAMSEGGFDLVLLDIMIPLMDGLKVLEKLKTSPPKSVNKKIIILTNLDHDLIMKKAVSHGVDGYLVKSDCTPLDVVEKVKEYLTVYGIGSSD